MYQDAKPPLSTQSTEKEIAELAKLHEQLEQMKAIPLGDSASLNQADHHDNECDD